MTTPHDDLFDPQGPLSARARARREAMRPMLERTVRTRRRRRAAVDTAKILGLLAAIVGVGIAMPLGARRPPARVAEHAAQPNEAFAAAAERAPRHAAMQFEMVRASVDVSRYTIDDDDLLAALRDAGLDVGLARRAGHAFLTGPDAPPEAPVSVPESVNPPDA